jgi:hypothetical protein
MSATRELRRRVRAEQSLLRFEPCLPRPASEPPTGPGWIHEVKHDGFRILAYRRGRNVRLFSRNGHNFADRFPRIAEAIEALPVRSCVVDGEAIVCDDGGLAVFDLVRGHATNARAVLCAFEWTRDGSKVDHMLYAASNLVKAREIFAAAIKHRPRIRLTIRQRSQVLEQWPAIGIFDLRQHSPR